MKKHLLGLAAAVLCLQPAFAFATYTYDLRGGGSSAIVTGSGYDTTYHFGSGPVGMSMSGWATTGWGGRLQTAQANRYDSGVGVCNRLEGKNCGILSHEVDNALGVDFLLFSFDEAVELVSLTIDPYLVSDRDVTYFIAEVSDLGDLNGKTLDTLPALWSTTVVNDDNPMGLGALDIMLGNVTGRHLLFGAQRGGIGIFDPEDAFKVVSLTYDVSAPPAEVPEPATLGLFGTMLAGVGTLALRRRRRS